MTESTSHQADVKLRAEDGCLLDATVYRPESENGIALQINSATAVQRRYYRAFAEYMARRGFVVLTYDYRDAFVVDPRMLRRSPASLSVWGSQDQAAATRQLRTSYPHHALALLGHSVGGQIVGHSPLAGTLSALLLVGAGHGYWRLYRDASRRWRRALSIYVLGPLALAAFGYMPGFAMGGGPRSAAYARELMRYARSPHFFCDAKGAAARPHHAELHCPVKQLTISDDEVAPPGTEIDLREFFPNARTEHEQLTPARYGLARLGHFGLFRRSMPHAAWQEIADWFASAAAARSPGRCGELQETSPLR
jgi:predicted alpha/beta hydrolase